MAFQFDPNVLRQESQGLPFNELSGTIVGLNQIKQQKQQKEYDKLVNGLKLQLQIENLDLNRRRAAREEDKAMRDNQKAQTDMYNSMYADIGAQRPLIVDQPHYNLWTDSFKRKHTEQAYNLLGLTGDYKKDAPRLDFLRDSAVHSASQLQEDMKQDAILSREKKLAQYKNGLPSKDGPKAKGAPPIKYPNMADIQKDILTILVGHDPAWINGDEDTKKDVERQWLPKAQDWARKIADEGDLERQNWLSGDGKVPMRPYGKIVADNMQQLQEGLKKNLEGGQFKGRSFNFFGTPSSSATTNQPGPKVKTKQPKAQQGLPTQNANGWKLLQDQNGNYAYVSPDGNDYEEVGSEDTTTDEEQQ